MTLAATDPQRHDGPPSPPPWPPPEAKIARLVAAGFALSRNDLKIIHYGQLLTTLTTARDADGFAGLVDAELNRDDGSTPRRRAQPQQQALFDRA